MRGSLSGVRARVDRLASRLQQSAQGGCSTCRGKEHTPQIRCVYGKESAAADVPAESRCDACGRLITYDYVVIEYHESMAPP